MTFSLSKRKRERTIIEATRLTLSLHITSSNPISKSNKNKNKINVYQIFVVKKCIILLYLNGISRIEYAMIFFPELVVFSVKFIFMYHRIAYNIRFALQYLSRFQSKLKLKTMNYRWEEAMRIYRLQSNNNKRTKNTIYISDKRANDFDETLPKTIIPILSPSQEIPIYDYYYYHYYYLIWKPFNRSKLCKTTNPTIQVGQMSIWLLHTQMMIVNDSEKHYFCMF